ncbi:MAG TPA: hypothetical protein VNT53_10545 [Pseudolysinimonas sp.]|nr:hypothetical protein [Pseudolysinimonas sp.]
MPRLVPLPLAAHQPFRTAEHANWGIGRGRLRSPDVAHPFHGINTAGGVPTSVRELAMACAPLLRDGDAFSHTTAALLFGAELPEVHERESQVHITSIGGLDRFRRRGVRGHRATEVPPLVLVGVLPVVAPAYVWFQLASVLSVWDLVAVGDRWTTPRRRGSTRRPPLVRPEELVHAVVAHAGQRGAVRAREALRLVRAGAESRMETHLRLLLAEAGLPEPLLNPGLRVRGETLHPDLFFDRWRVVLEYEGDGHRTDPRQWRQDIWRREAFEEAGYRVVRVHRDDLLAEPQAFLARVRRILAQREGRA